MTSSNIAFAIFGFVFHFLFPSLMARSTNGWVTRIEQCEPIKIPRCQAMPYNLTQMPNLMHHNTQKNARLVFEKFEILIDQHCSEDLLFFLCSLFVPVCPVSLKSVPIPPCRKICERARAGCEPLMRSFNVSWPESMECSNFPLYDKGLCVVPTAFVTPVPRKKCKCKRKRPSLKMLRKHKYDYAVRVRVQNRVKVSKMATKYHVKVTQFLFYGKVKFFLNKDTVIWANSTSKCGCPPKLRSGREYLVMGNEDRLTNRLTMNRHSVAGRWKDSWPRRVKRWRIRLQPRSRSQRRWMKKNRRRHRQRERRPNSNTTTDVKRPSGSRRKQWPPRTNTNKPGKNHRKTPWRASPVPGIIDGYTHGGRFYAKTKKRKLHNRSAYPSSSTFKSSSSSSSSSSLSSSSSSSKN